MTSREDFATLVAPEHLDPMTGIPNLAPLNEELDYLLEYEPGTFGVIVADANGLKKKNDVEGHEAGNEFVIGIAEVLAGSVRHNREDASENDIIGLVARTGGDEFVIAVRNVHTQEELEKITGRVKQRLVEKDLSVSLGCHLHDGTQTKSELLNAADMDMYVKKRVASLETINFRQAVALKMMGRIATVAGLDLRDAPNLLSAIRERDQERESRTARAFSAGSQTARAALSALSSAWSGYRPL
ncbi:MAG: diguanylate cyclase [Candidatus Saccharibacteria bacterium]|nr:diguanylate cyclase [Candidatus Saccharibacteria bacterium]